MLVKKIKLENFRNYESLELEFSPDINYIYGNNGHGKTNIVEAVYMFASLKSHRVNHDFEMIKDGCEFARIEMDFANRERDFNASVVFPFALASNILPTVISVKIIAADSK